MVPPDLANDWTDMQCRMSVQGREGDGKFPLLELLLGCPVLALPLRISSQVENQQEKLLFFCYRTFNGRAAGILWVWEHEERHGSSSQWMDKFFNLTGRERNVRRGGGGGGRNIFCLPLSSRFHFPYLVVGLVTEELVSSSSHFPIISIYGCLPKDPLHFNFLLCRIKCPTQRLANRNNF